MTKNRYMFIWVLLIMGGVFFFSSQDGDTSNLGSQYIATHISTISEQITHEKLVHDDVNLILRKLAHFSEYLLLGVVTVTTLANLTGRFFLSVPITGILIIGFAFCDEWFQRFTPGRNSSLFDVMVDSSGVIVGLIAYMIFILIFRRRSMMNCTDPMPKDKNVNSLHL